MSNCSSCSSSSTCDKEECLLQSNSVNNIKNIIGIMSGKGGVGKSSISVIISKQLTQLGFKVGILDADITGPSIPRLIGLKDKKAENTKDFILPVETEDGIKVMSLNLLIDDENSPVIWRGPIIAGAVKQFWSDVLWGELDYLIIDMPPGTGDVALTVMQSIPINGLVMISVPQDLVSMIVNKAIIMARTMNIKVLGIIENMSYIKCPDCNKKIKLFTGENVDRFLEDSNLNLLGELPMVSSICNLSNGSYEGSKDSLQESVYPIVRNILNSLEEDN